MTDLEELKKLAEAAGRDGWIASGWAQGDRGFEVYRRGTHDRVCADMVQSVAHFIAAANPQTVLALIRELEEARRNAERPAWESTTPAYTKYITVSKYRKLRPSYQKWYRPICQCAARQP